MSRRLVRGAKFEVLAALPDRYALRKSLKNKFHEPIFPITAE